MKYVEILQSDADIVLYHGYHLAAKEMEQKRFQQNNRALKNCIYTWNSTFKWQDIKKSKMIMISLSWQKQFASIKYISKYMCNWSYITKKNKTK